MPSQANRGFSHSETRRHKSHSHKSGPKASDLTGSDAVNNSRSHTRRSSGDQIDQESDVIRIKTAVTTVNSSRPYRSSRPSYAEHGQHSHSHSTTGTYRHGARSTPFPISQSSPSSQSRGFSQIITDRSGHRADSRLPVSSDTSDNRHSPVVANTSTFSRFNTSLVSLFSTLTGVTDRSSGSASTVTQQSYLRAMSKISEPTPPNVFDYMLPPSDTAPVMPRVKRQSRHSSSSSSYVASDAGSSDDIGTPSSRSTAPSPTDARFKSTSGHHLARHSKSRKGSEHSRGRAALNAARRPSTNSSRTIDAVSQEDDDESDNEVDHQNDRASDEEEDDGSDVDENDSGNDDEETAFQHDHGHVQTKVSHDTRIQNSHHRHSMHYSDDAYDPYRTRPPAPDSHAAAEQLRIREEERRRHMAYALNVQRDHPRPASAQSQLRSVASATSVSGLAPKDSALMQHSWHSTSPQTSHYNVNHSTHEDRQIATSGHPTAPEPPSLAEMTVTGYEKIALALSSTDSGIRPLYRKFEYLNNRVLLHLQDELSELEEQLRIADEVVAQLQPGPSNAHRVPASRRAETYSMNEIHTRRIHLLGRIFAKTEQYNRAISAYASICENSTRASASQVEAYRQWMAEHDPVNELEARFLLRDLDLVELCSGPASRLDQVAKTTAAAPQAMLTHAPVVLMLPLLLFSLIPTLSGRMVVTALIMVAAGLVTTSTEIRHLLSVREWAICGTIYVILMGTIAGCIPSH